MFENEIIENIGGLHKNSLLHISNAEGEEEDSVTYKSVVNHSPYVDDVTFVSKLKHKKNCFTILSTNIAQKISLKIKWIANFSKKSRGFWNFSWCSVYSRKLVVRAWRHVVN